MPRNETGQARKTALSSRAERGTPSVASLPLPRSSATTFLLAVIALATIALPGCSGCFDPPPPTAQKSDPKKKDEKPKPNFDTGRMGVLPTDGTDLTGVKPGHWVTASLPIKPNNFDFQGTLESFAAEKDASRPVPLEEMPHRLTFVRPAALAKGQTKFLELMYYIPRRDVTRRVAAEDAILTGEEESLKIWLQGRLLSRAGSLETAPLVQAVEVLPGHQFHMIVLSAQPERYGYLRTLDAVKLNVDKLVGGAANAPYYQVISPKIDKRVAVPSHPLAWTTVAVVVWDDLDPNLLTPEQREAMLDWLHWGGQLIVSGPSSLASLKGSFLAPYLPALGGKAEPIEPARFAELDEAWTLPEGRQRKRRPIPFVQDKPPMGIELLPQPGGKAVPKSAELAYESRVGRGRVVVTAMSLSAREWVNWPCFDNFYNACLLRRPARRYHRTSDQFTQLDWADSAVFRRLDPRLVSNVRYLSRDLGNFGSSGALNTLTVHSGNNAPIIGYMFDDGTIVDVEPTGPARERVTMILRDNGSRQMVSGLPPENAPPAAPSNAPPTAWTLDSPPAPERGYVIGQGDSGVAGWTDFSGVANAARESLKEAAGITVPNVNLVVQALAIYLLVLVPVNWAFFWAIGRVEWAWIMAPLIAIGGAVAVVRSAQLDIGFVRSRTELCVLEMQAGYPRAHLTRYTAVYTSLSTGYDLVYDSPSALGQPFAVGGDKKRQQLQSISDVTFRRDDQPSLRGFQVISNSTGLLHSEQMYDLGGGLSFRLVAGDPALQNDSDLPLQAAGLIRRTAAGKIEAAWLGDVAAKKSVPVRFAEPPAEGGLFPKWNDLPATRRNSELGELNLRRLLDLVEDPRGLANGDVRLVGYTSAPLAGMTVEPAAAQEGSLSLVVAHLAWGDWPEPKSDVNTKADVETDVEVFMP